MLRRSTWAFNYAANGIELLESDPESLGLDAKSYDDFVRYAGRMPITGENRGRLMAVINGEAITLKNRQQILGEKIRTGDRSDPDGLREWLGSLDDPALHLTADQALEQFDSQTDSKPSVDGDIAKFVGPERLDYSAIKRISMWTPTETGKALEAFRSLSPEAKQVSFESVRDGLEYGGTNFSFYKEIFAEASKFPPSEVKNARNQIKQTLAFQSFSSNYASMEPAKAAEWAAQLAPGRDRLNAIHRVATTWRNYSPAETEAWIRTLPAVDQAAAKESSE